MYLIYKISLDPFLTWCCQMFKTFLICLLYISFIIVTLKSVWNITYDRHTIKNWEISHVDNCILYEMELDEAAP